MRDKMSALIVVLHLSLMIVPIFWSSGCRQRIEPESQSPTLKLTLALQPSPTSGLIAIADERGFFKNRGVEVKIGLYPSGLDSLKAVMRGEAQLATVADIAFAGKMFEDPSLRIIASIGATVGNQVVARRDRSIQQPSDLKGKRIGYSPGTSSHYFLHAFLLTNHVSRNEITTVAIPPEKQVESVVTGEVDAVSAFDVYAFDIERRLGKNALSWDSQNNLDYQWLLAARENATRSPEAIKRFLGALVMAEAFILKNGDEAKAIISRKWDIDPGYVSHSWHQTRLFVSFNRSIITSLRNYVRWEIQRKGKTEDPPDVLNYLHTAALKEIDPRLVTIFR
ncbi:MAG: ABC transporter substrate-binding protein [Desulfobacteraceae bacterium]|nr:MAG: ABC transporter substrate-binding protein [Desulfobacteraceae bacterium]